ncbi:unnamed protein product [Fraxinus pennsylvanica]|uniref:Uncharacterized protein n=1 Tax=Fraxinus pennsylvanica TaxID=56036 RepID=A0AAD1ZTQ9_9LAMI|nr:unnamed protein product [Fraxinus pennsylvanica]
MPSSLALKRAVGSAALFNRLLNPIQLCSVAPYNTNAEMTPYGWLLTALTRKIIGSCSDAFDPFFPTSSLSQVLNMMDNPFMSAGCGRGVGAGIRRGWDLPSRHAWT